MAALAITLCLAVSGAILGFGWVFGQLAAGYTIGFFTRREPPARTMTKGWWSIEKEEMHDGTEWIVLHEVGNDDSRMVVSIGEGDDPDVRMVYACAKCGWAETCEECHT